MKIFMWRAARNLLPTAENLWKMKCLKDPICQRCNREVKTVRHALLDCKVARKIWYHASTSVQISNAQHQDILEFIYEVWSCWGKAEAEQTIALCWAVWFAKNKRIFEGKNSDPRASAAKAESLLEAYHRARKPDVSHIHNVKRVVQKKWEPPPENFLKVNVDAAINSRDQVSGLGAVIKDPSGKIVAAGTKQVPLREGVSFAEAEAMEWGLQVAKELSLSALIMESDCKEVVDLLNNTKGSRTGISWVISEIQEQRRDFKEVKFRHIPRTCNTCAHSLAKLAVGANTSAVWLDHIPAEILNVLNSVV
ncbi:hypothetical protein AB3S75_027379 [Citrus x aurantiifolia]